MNGRMAWLIAGLALGVITCSTLRPTPPEPPSRAGASHRGRVIYPLYINPQGPSYNGNALDDVYFSDNFASLPASPDAGAVEITSQDGGRYRIEAVGMDPCTPTSPFGGGGLMPLVLYQLTDEKGRNPCHGEGYVDPYKRCAHEERLQDVAVAVPGRWEHDGGDFDGCDGGASCFTVACITGMVGHCAHWGYVPGFTLPDAGTLQLYHLACVRAARADYGNGQSFTCGATLVDFIDRLGIQKQEDAIEDFDFESAWNPTGAAMLGVEGGSLDGGLPCVKPRYRECNDLISQVLTEHWSQDAGALVDCGPPGNDPRLDHYFAGRPDLLLLTRSRLQGPPCGPGCVVEHRHCGLGSGKPCPLDAGAGP